MASKVTMKFLINELLMTFPGAKQDKDEMLQLWTKFFSHVPDEVLEESVDNYLMDSEFFPTISDIFAGFDSEDVTAEEAWNDAVHYAHAMASYHGVTAGLAMAPTQDPEPQPPSEVVAEVMKSIRWNQIAYSSENNLPFIRKEFMAIYEDAIKKIRKERRQAIRTGDPKVIASLGKAQQTKDSFPENWADMTPDEKRRYILTQGASAACTEPSSDVSEHSGELSELTKEEEDDILDGRRIVDATEVF